MKGERIMIPKTIHYCWFGGDSLPPDVKQCIASWKKYAPDYEIVEWNENNFDVQSHPFMKAAYDAKAWAFVSDYARLKVIYEHGGIYLDTDVELLKKPDFLLENPCYIGVQQQGRLCTTGLGFGAEKSSPVVHKMMRCYDNLIFSVESLQELACPRLNNEVIKGYGYQSTEEIWKCGEVTVFPCRYFDPLSPGDTSNLLCPETVSIHHYSASWTGRKNRWKRKVFRLLGEERVHKMKKLIKR
jgi:mannosyltransferase OCH1-like enzyme